jgi:hypothetical protein
MKRFLRKVRKVKLSRVQEIALLCGAMALLIMAAVFVSGGGMERVARAVATGGLSPYSLTAGIFPCSWTDSCAPTTTYYFSLTASPGSIVSGQAVLLTYTAGSRSSDGVVGNFCDGNWLNNLLGISCTLTDFGTVYSPSGSMTGSVYAYPTATRTYTLCQTGVGAKCTSATVYVTQPAPSAPTTLTSLAANPATVTSGSPASLSWTGVKGTRFSACRLVGGQWGASGAWFTAHPGSISTSPLTTTTTYNMACYDTDGASTPWRSATVTVTAPAGPDICTDVPGVQNSVPSGCAGPVPSPVGTCVPSGSTYNGSACVPLPVCTGAHQVGTPPNCACDVGYQMQGGSCVQMQCPGAHEVNWPACSCEAGYVRDAGTNACVREPELDITVNGQEAVRVRRGSDVTVAWSATGVTAGSCRVTTNTGATLASADSGSQAATVDHQTTYTLSCTNDAGSGVSKEANATLIPEVIEQ